MWKLSAGKSAKLCGWRKQEIDGGNLKGLLIFCLEMDKGRKNDVVMVKLE